MAHPHAQNMSEYAEDAMMYKEPWKLWQVWDPQLNRWLDLKDHPYWRDVCTYRRKPQKWEPAGGQFDVETELGGPEFHRSDARYADELYSLLRNVARLHAWRCENGESGVYGVVMRNGAWYVVEDGTGVAPTDVRMDIKTAEKCAKALNDGYLDLYG